MRTVQITNKHIELAFVVSVVFALPVSSAEILQLTNNDYNDIHPQIHNGQVVWYGFESPDSEIFYWNGTSVEKLTDNDENDFEPQIHNGQVVWTADDASRNSAQIVYWNGNTVQQLTYSYDSQNRRPQIHNAQVVWQGHDGNDNEIYFWSGINSADLDNDGDVDAIDLYHFTRQFGNVN